MEFITEHPILEIPERKKINFSFDGIILTGFEGMVISSALFLNKIKIFGRHVKDNSPQGMFCANGQCAQCNVIVNGIPVKACMTPLKEGMVIESCNGLPELPAIDNPVTVGDSKIIDTEILVIGAGPAGLSATKILGENNLKVILIDDKAELGGKLVLQTHKFFGSQEDVYAGTRGIHIAKILGDSVRTIPNVNVWFNSVCLAVFSDGLVGILKNNNEYVLVKPNYLLVATGAREKMLVFPGNTLPGVYGAGAFQTLVNRDLIKSAEKIFIVGGGNVGLIAGYHAIQAGIEVVGLIEALAQCGGYKVHEDKLRRLGVPIYTNHTIISANGENSVESITIAQIDKNFNIVPGTEKTFNCDTILIAVGLNPVDEFYHKAKEFRFKVWVAGDAQEIAEASAAIFTGKIEGLKILKEIGIKISEDIDKLEDFADIMKAKPPQPIETEIKFKEEGVYPVFYCTQEIPCNPCTSVCDQQQIETIDDLITQLPYFKGDQDCIGCGKCVAVCPGLAVLLIDYRKDKKNPLVTFPFELTKEKLEKGQQIIVVSNVKELGVFEIHRSRILKEFPKTQLISVKLPSEIAKQAVAIKMIGAKFNEPIDFYQKAYTDDEIIVCRCERVSVGEIRNWIRSGVKDFNELKALTKVGMGACGGKTCTPLIERIFREEGVSVDDITPGTKRPLFIEVPMGIFANVKDKEEL
jgi:NADPH-dependent 2,4-dienoyl-CoA reductase/sulfur reductase-like enzyme/Fe-S-cluster-containing hydrogenase component 2/bacterioferritin-associated ferredoxin